MLNRQTNLMLSNQEKHEILELKIRVSVPQKGQCVAVYILNERFKVQT